MLAVVESNTLALREDVGLERLEPGIVVGERLAADGIFDAPIDHIAEEGDAPQLHLVFGIGFRMGIGTVGMAHVAGHGIGAAKCLCVMKNAFAFRHQLIRRLFPDLLVALGKSAIGLELAPGSSAGTGQLGFQLERAVGRRDDPSGIGMLASPFLHQRIGDLLTLLARQLIAGLDAFDFDRRFSVAETDNQIAVRGRRQLMVRQIASSQGRSSGKRENKCETVGAHGLPQ